MFKLSRAILCVLLSVCVRADEEQERAAPRDVHFHSVNLRNVVRWSSGTNDTRSINYTVEYMKYGDGVYVDGIRQEAWRSVQQCDVITQTECDLTEQTNDTEEGYFARVRANGPNGSSDWAVTDRFRLFDTILGPPQLNVTVVENKLQVKLSGPFRWRKDGQKQEFMFNFFSHMSYNISIYNNSKYNSSSISMQNFPELKKLKFGPLEYHSQYCVRAQAMSLLDHPSTMWSDWSCISTAEDPFKSQLLLLTLGGFLPTAICLFVLVAVGAFAYYYIYGHKEQLPQNVKNIRPNENIRFQTEKHFSSTNLIILNSTDLNTAESKPPFLSSFRRTVDVPQPPVFPAPQGGYAAQDVQPGSKGHRSSVSDDYGVVHLDAGAQTSSSTSSGVNSYTVQPEMTEPAQERHEEEEEEEEEQSEDPMPDTFLTWDQNPVPLQLDFPLLSVFSLKTSDTNERPPAESRPLLQQRPDLTSVGLKQVSEETRDDDPLLKIEQLWDLKVQSISE